MGLSAFRGSFGRNSRGRLGRQTPARARRPATRPNVGVSERVKIAGPHSLLLEGGFRDGIEAGRILGRVRFPAGSVP
jgi:hypothetical protein